MERLIISRGHHPNEATAFSLALKVQENLEKKGYEVELVDIPLPTTPLGKLIKGESTTNKDWIRKTFRRTGARLLVSFHNSPFPDFKSPFFYEEKAYGDRKRLILEIPAIYKPITSRVILDKADNYVNRSDNAGKPGRNDYANAYMRRVASVPESTEKGLMGKKMVKKITHLIESYIEKRL